ncbi:MAG: porin, partial [Mesorhizobium sp.]|nr:porin [Mesorhizobium sp.]
ADSGNGGPSNYGSHSWGGLFYGYQQRALIGYRFDANGFFGAISLEDDNLAGEGYMPDVVAKIGYAGGWGAVWLKVAYDESFAVGAIDGGFAAQLGAQFNMPNMPGSSLRLIAFYADGDHAYNVGAPGVVCATGLCGPPTLLGGAEWSILASYNQQFSSTLGASIGFQYFNDLYIAGTDLQWGVNAWAAEASVVWTPITNFEVRGELVYTDVGNLDNVPGGLGLDPNGTLSGYLRFTRYF